jgi:hypothetical protein
MKMHMLPLRRRSNAWFIPRAPLVSLTPNLRLAVLASKTEKLLAEKLVGCGY